MQTRGLGGHFERFTPNRIPLSCSLPEQSHPRALARVLTCMSSTSIPSSSPHTSDSTTPLSMETLRFGSRYYHNFVEHAVAIPATAVGLHDERPL